MARHGSTLRHRPFKTITNSHLEKNVDDKDIEDIFERIDDTVKHSLEFGNTFYSLEWSQNAEDSEGLDGA